MTLRGAILLTVKVLFVAATSGLILFLSFYLAVRTIIFGNEVQVPSLAGQTVDGSESLLSPVGLTVQLAGEQYSPTVPKGEIISQIPPAGATIKTNRKVKVIVSRGTEVLQTPDLAGRSQRQALLELERLGLAVGEVANVSSHHPVDRVVAQDPQAGAEIFRGDRVSLLVSRGPREPVFVMPDLAGQPLERVQRVLGDSGLRVTQTRRERSRAPEGTILRQFPRAGYPVSRRDAITVVVSRGPWS